MGNLLAIICGILLANGHPALDADVREEQIFRDVERGIAAGSVAQFSEHLGPQLYLQLPESEGAHYSANQAFYVLDRFLRTHKIVGMKFTTFGTSESNPYATGTVAYTAKGIRQNGQVYVALARRDDRWVITHLSIY
jgi:hypothetical protein